MRRREFITLLGGAAAAWPRAVRAQQPPRVARIGYLALTAAWQHASGGSDAFRAGLRDLGYVEGKNLQIEFRFAEGNEDRLPALATELVSLNVDVIVTYATGVYAARQATATIPIVVASGGDLVAMGIIASLSHPGGNITGSTFFFPELAAKRLELLKELVPSMSRAGILMVRGNPANGLALQTTGAAANALRVELRSIEVGGPNDFESAFSALADNQVDGFVVWDHTLFIANAAAIAALATKHHLPSIGPLELPANGGLMAYGVNFADLFRRAATFVDKILKGAKPGDIPVEQATRFKTILNLKIANALGLDVPTSILLRADEVIE
jgi:putative ABC transport system substrate-binding protein